ncbi:hypothetical protein WKH56_19750 [Priestia sp. SB1]|uniref:hypothetical protein n=1 Tax=Priestia sp. SB1 TaxID=3132359 RepID=UPI00317D58CB
MKIDNITEGQIIKNYKSLCKELGVQVKVGKSRQLQLKDLERYFSYYKDGNSFIIKEIYDEPIKKVSMRGKSEGSRNNNTIYGDLIRTLIADLLVNQKKKHISISRNHLLERMNMINENYGFCSKNVKELASMYNIEPYMAYDFFNTSNSNFKNAVETALDHLHAQRLLWYKMIVKVGLHNGEHREAEVEELDLINRYELLALEDTPEEFKTVKSLHMTKYWRPFKEQVNKSLKENTHIKYYYNAYFISVEQDYLEKERDKLVDFILEDNNRRQIKNELNGIVQNHLAKNAQKRHDNVSKSTSVMWKVRNKLEYTDKIKQLIKLLINDEQENIIVKLVERSKSRITKESQQQINNLFN